MIPSHLYFAPWLLGSELHDHPIARIGPDRSVQPYSQSHHFKNVIFVQITADSTSGPTCHQQASSTKRYVLSMTYSGLRDSEIALYCNRVAYQGYTLVYFSSPTDWITSQSCSPTILRVGSVKYLPHLSQCERGEWQDSCPFRRYLSVLCKEPAIGRVLLQPPVLWLSIFQPFSSSWPSH